MRWYELLDEKLRDYLPDLPVSAEEPLSKYTSFRIGGPARPPGMGPARPGGWPSPGTPSSWYC